jgi:hypothetical protein
MAATTIKFGFRDEFDRSAFLRELGGYSGWRGDTASSSGILTFQDGTGPVQLDYSTDSNPDKLQGKYSIAFRASDGAGADTAFARLSDHAERHNVQSVAKY